MNNQAYLNSCTKKTMEQHLEICNVVVDYSKMKDANVAALIEKDDGITTTYLYILASIKPQNRNVEVYLSDKDEVVTTDIVDLFKVCQRSICWVELN